MSSSLTEETIAEGLEEERGVASDERVGERDSEFDYARTPRHRTSRTQRPDGTPADEHDEDEETAQEPKKGGFVRTVLILLGGVVFLAVILVLLVYFLGQRGNGTQMQAGTSGERLGAQRELDAARQEADEVKNAVTEAAQPKPTSTPATNGGLPPANDLSLPVMPDPLSTSPYAPNSTPPPITDRNSGSDTNTDTAAGTNSSKGGGGSATEDTGASQRSTQGSDRQIERLDRSGSGSRPGSFYFFSDASQASRQSIGEGQARTYLPGRDAPNTLIKPPFGVLLPVRLLDSVLTLRDGGVVRLETTRATGGPGGWRIPRGTTVVAKLAGGDRERAYLNVIGVIDAATNRLISFTGEVKGSDGAQGIRGERKRVNSIFKSIFKEAGRAGLSLGSAFLLGRRGGSGYIPQTQIGVPGSNGSPSSATAITDFLYVRAGAQGYVMVTDLPASVEGRDAESIQESGELTDDEMSRLLSDGTPAQIRAALPRMNPELRQLVETILAQETRTK